VARIGVVIVGLYVADASVIVLELPLNDKIGVFVVRQLELIIAGVLVVERDCKVLATGSSGRYVFGARLLLGSGVVGGGLGSAPAGPL
jgi:hypothetical protein